MVAGFRWRSIIVMLLYEKYMISVLKIYMCFNKIELLRNCLEQGLRVRSSGVDLSVNEHAEDERNAVIGNFGVAQ